MFRRGHDFKVARIITLQTFDESDSQSRSEIRVFTVRLLSAAPARVAKDVDIRTPISQTLVAGVLVMAQELVMFGAGLGRNYVGNLMHEIGVPGGGEPNRLRKNSRIAGARDAVQALVP